MSVGKKSPAGLTPKPFNLGRDVNVQTSLLLSGTPPMKKGGCIKNGFNKKNVSIKCYIYVYKFVAVEDDKLPICSKTNPSIERQYDRK